jgi:hypothetical protein
VRIVPVVGMPVRIVHLGAAEDAEIEDVLDDGRTVVVAGERYALHRMTGHWVREGDPYYGRRLSFTPEP